MVIVICLLYFTYVVLAGLDIIKIKMERVVIFFISGTELV
jgi:hypothetical protein